MRGVHSWEVGCHLLKTPEHIILTASSALRAPLGQPLLSSIWKGESLDLGGVRSQSLPGPASLPGPHPLGAGGAPVEGRGTLLTASK